MGTVRENRGERMLRIATIGAGRWGCIHASKIAAHDNAELVAMVDTDLTLAVEAAEAFGAREAARCLNDLTVDFDAVTVAVPIEQLASAATSALTLGKAVLMEKPGGASVKELRHLAQMASTLGVPVFVGYLERFNAALDVIPTPIDRLVIWRGGPTRIGGATVPLDWTCHDVNLAQFLMNDELRTIERAYCNGHRAYLRLRGHGGREVRIHTVCDARRIRRKLWADGHAYDLMSGNGDALGAQIASFIGHLTKGYCGRLASLDEAISTMEILEQVQWAGLSEVSAS
jgi:predicted dehydrogenase